MKKGTMISVMIDYAVNMHSGQHDKSGMPYILHPLKVMHYLKTDDEELMCIAIGHDLLEDTGASERDILNMTSERVCDAIKALTKYTGQTYEEYKEAVFANKDAMLVKLADLRHNSDIRRLKGVTEKDIQRLDRYCKFYNEIKERLSNEIRET